MVEYPAINTTSKTSFESLQNHFLMAMPQMQDPNFVGSLTYICEHNEEGAMGIVINRPTQYGMVELLGQLDLELSDVSERLVYAGGPVQKERGFIIHDGDKIWQSTLELSESLKLTTSLDILEAISVGEGPDNFLVALGYAGWGKGQLESELSENTWLTCPATQDIVFSADDEKKLEKAMSLLGIQADQLSGQIGHA